MLSRVIKSTQTVNIVAEKYCYPEAFVPAADFKQRLRRKAMQRFPGSPQEEVSPLLSEEELADREKAAYERGLHDAETRYQEQLKALTNQTARALARSLKELDQLQKRLYEEAEKQVAKLALEVAKKIVRREVRIDEQIVLAMIKVAMSYVSDARKVKVRVNPADLNIIRSHVPAEEEFSPGMPPPEWIADPAIERGGFIIDSDAGTVDGRLGMQFQEIEKSFFGLSQN
jgi:flagellar assembly protein FliH